MDDCLSVATPLHTNWLLMLKKQTKQNSAGFPALGTQSGHVKRKSTKFLVNGDQVTCNNCLHSSAWLFSQSFQVVCSLMSKTNAFLVWDISTIVAHPGRSAYWWGCRGALSSQLGQRKSHHISNFSSAEVVTVVATKITVVSDEHQNCVGWGGKNLS